MDPVIALAVMVALGAGGSIGSAAIGYGVRVLVERYEQRARERVVRVLAGDGGELPDWEVKARELDDLAHRYASRTDKFPTDVDMGAASRLRREADVTRKRGRQRDRQGA